MRYLLTFISIVLLLSMTACERKDHQEIPAYIKIDTCFLKVDDPSLQGSESHNIKDVWVYIGNQLQGIYELPVTFPILQSGPTNILLRAGILINGTSNLRIYYPFYERINPGETILTPGEVTTITPTFNYIDNEFITYEWLENYENMMTRLLPGNLSDTSLTILTGNDVFEGNFCGEVVLENNRTYFELFTDPAFDNLPTDGKPVYFEMDYKIDSAMLVGIQAELPGLNIVNYDIVFLRPTEGEWKKIYINLTTGLSQFYDANKIKIYFKGGSPAYDNIDKTSYCWDNLKLIY